MPIASSWTVIPRRLRGLEGEEERELPLRTGGHAEATIRALDEEVDWPADEIELVEEIQPEAGVDEGGDDLAERVVPAVLDEALRRRVPVGIRALHLEPQRLG